MGHDYDNPYSNEKLTEISRFQSIDFDEGNQSDDYLNKKISNDDMPCFRDPYRELFLWAVLTSRFKISTILWRKISYPTAGALVAANILLRMSESYLLKKNSKVIKKLQDQARLDVSSIDQQYALPRSILLYNNFIIRL